ncbi:CotS family spore coat protein [Cohnella yongneupensis]|uniref:CotS family spore coat protein n=1 Tax=Cohnella yongneupensis TaxID=425006 RepID=A0ABW0R9I9_9BACL
MEEYRIVPWDQDSSIPFGVDREFYIPPEVEEIAREVITHYDMKVSEMTLITSKPDKGGAIWKIETDKGPRSLKCLHREPRRSLFSVYAQQWLVEQGARVPALVKTKEGALYLEAGGKLWIVTDWIPLVPASKVDLEGAEALIYGLGEFHRATRGFIPPKFAHQSSRIHNWPKYYSKMIEKIGWFKDLAAAYPETTGSGQLLQVAEHFQQQAKDAMAKFEKSSFRKMVGKGEKFWGLVHQDFGFSNGQMGPDGIWVIDLDGVSYDFPIRDLRKIITSSMDDMGIWDPEIMRKLIQAYHQANPIDRETYELLLNDMAFPNEFYKHIKEMIFDPELFMNTELELVLTRVLATQESKTAALAELERDITNYAPGDYVEVSVEQKRLERMKYLQSRGDEEIRVPLVAGDEFASMMPTGETSEFDLEEVPSPIDLGAELSEVAEDAVASNAHDAGFAPVLVFGDNNQSASVSPFVSAQTSDTIAAGAITSPVPPIVIPLAAGAVAGPSDSTKVPLRKPGQRTNRTIRRRKRIIRRRKSPLPARKTKTKSTVRSKSPRKSKPRKSVVYKTANVAKRKLNKTRVRKLAKRA